MIIRKTTVLVAILVSSFYGYSQSKNRIVTWDVIEQRVILNSSAVEIYSDLALISAINEEATNYSESLEEINDLLILVHASIRDLQDIGRVSPGELINNIGYDLADYLSLILSSDSLSNDEIVDMTIERFSIIRDSYQAAADLKFEMRDHIDRVYSESQLIVSLVDKVVSRAKTEHDSLSNHMQYLKSIDKTDLSITDQIDLEDEIRIVEAEILVLEELQVLLEEYKPDVQAYIDVLKELSAETYRLFSSMGVTAATLDGFLQLLEVKQTINGFNTMFTELQQDLQDVLGYNQDLEGSLDEISTIYDSLNSLL